MLTEETKRMLLSPGCWEIISSFLPMKPKEIPVNEVPDSDQKKLNFHFHREILIPLTGVYTFSLNDKYYRCEPGKIFLIDSGENHELTYSNVSSEITHLWVWFLGNKIFGKYLRINPSRIDFSNRFTIEEIDTPSDIKINTAWSLLKKQAGPDCPLLLVQKFLVALSWLFIKIIENSEQQQSGTQAYREAVIKAAQIHIKNGLKQGISSEQLARVAGYSKFHFLRLFKEYSGFTVHEYTNLCRRDTFTKLHKENIPSKEIGYRLGFSSSTSFYNWLCKMRKRSEL